jgi:hypothetical protein
LDAIFEIFKVIYLKIRQVERILHLIHYRPLTLPICSVIQTVPIKKSPPHHQSILIIAFTNLGSLNKLFHLFEHRSEFSTKPSNYHETTRIENPVLNLTIYIFKLKTTFILWYFLFDGNASVNVTKWQKENKLVSIKFLNNSLTFGIKIFTSINN